ncbi:MAG: hypothetical protein QG599_954 [Pseudomonadota bacterium]|nr:hypothetical protein [Pseudomonadota bacterium]
MALLTATTLKFEEKTLLENLTQPSPNSVVMMVVDGVGTKQFFRLNTDGIQENETILCNTTTGICLKYINGQWV